jgi:hypothetical protein
MSRYGHLLLEEIGIKRKTLEKNFHTRFKNTILLIPPGNSTLNISVLTYHKT